MSIKSRADLTTQINVIRFETEQYANTPERVGSCLQNIMDSCVNINDYPVIYQGLWDASTNTLPTLGKFGDFIRRGYVWSDGDTTSTTLLGPDGNIVLPWATLQALVDNPGPDLTDQTKWLLNY